MNLADIQKIYNPVPVVKKETKLPPKFTPEEREKVINDCKGISCKERRAYGKIHGYSLYTINYFIYQENARHR
jgi:hypothetical protein